MMLFPSPNFQRPESLPKYAKHATFANGTTPIRRVIQRDVTSALIDSNASCTSPAFCFGWIIWDVPQPAINAVPFSIETRHGSCIGLLSSTFFLSLPVSCSPETPVAHVSLQEVPDTWHSWHRRHPIVVVEVMAVCISVAKNVDLDFRAALVAEILCLQSSSKRLVLLLLPSPLFLPAPLPFDVVDQPADDDGNVHVHLELIVRSWFCVVEPRAITRLPLLSTYHTELCCAAARHVIAAFLQLDHGLALEAPLPAPVFSDVEEFCRLWVVWTRSCSVPLEPAGCTHFGFAFAAHSNLAPFDARRRDMRWFYPFAATLRWAIQPIRGCEFCISLVPQRFELYVKQLIHMLQRYVVCGTAPRGHMGRVGDRQGEDASETGITHSMSASEERSA